jgi:8-oxo-dGTP diphosphatase
MTSSDEVPLYIRDPDAWLAHLAEGNRTQPRKRVGADVLFRDEEGRILLVNPRYKPDWDLPGGMAEANESPLDAARREIKEELGIEWEGDRLLVVDWVPPHGPWDDSLMFVFDGGVMTVEGAAGIRVVDDELQDCQFVVTKVALDRLRPSVARRVAAACDAVARLSAQYCHDGSRLLD